ncbi:hypothetical protein [Sinisalibacter aestuarii]|uniref:Tetratricopeptide repeat protein n=1 Tax=Sinisalibacter aestuarii TaxID=2949426 RepID=A0ABQ5LZI9_9RHOB|nr:hypothetical protein [Sinisalibacter aestuarii]GKY89572.1 hypothetical protein STA1M1_34410 [Sinisalibacter aestuarii]
MLAMTLLRSAFFASLLASSVAGTPALSGPLDCAGALSDCLLDAARDSSDEIDRPILRDEAHFAIAVALARLGQLGPALDEAGRIANAATLAEAMGEISGAAARAGDFDAAYEIAFAMLDARNRSARVQALENLAVEQAAVGEVDAAFETVVAIDNPYRRSEAQAAIATSVARSGDIAGAIRAASRIATDYWFSSDQPRFKIASGLVSRSGEFDHFWFYEALVNIAVVQARGGDIVGALKTAKSIPDQGGRSRAMAQVAVVQAETGDIDGARATAGRIEAAYGDQEAVTAIAAGLAMTGDAAGALALAQDIQRAYGDGAALVAVAAQQARAGDFEASLDTVRKIDVVQDRVRAQAAISREIAQNGRLDEAMTVLSQLTDAKDRFNTMADIAAMLTRAGEAEAALEMIRSGASRRDMEDLIVQVVLTEADLGETTQAVETALAIEDPMFRAIALAGIAERQP